MAEFELVDVNFGDDGMAELGDYVDKQIDWLTESHSDLWKNRIPKWRKLYLGTPAEETKNFPWPNASNIIVQVVGEIVDTIAARVLGLLYATHPLWAFQDFRKFDPDKRDDLERAENERRALENFMDLVGYEPDELDLYRLEGLWYTDAARLGTAFLTVGFEDIQEVTTVGYTSSKSKAMEGEESTVYFGPRVYKLRHEDVALTPDASTPGQAEFVFKVRTLRRKALEERGFIGAYHKNKVDVLLGQPDRSRPAPQKDEELKDSGVSVRGPYDATAEWDIHECYFSWWHNKHKYRIIASYHKKTKAMLRCVFNFLPDNQLPVLRARMGYRTDGMYGHGFAELLERYQEELSTVHNQRVDNATAANTRALRVSPRARNLDTNFELYPMALLVGEKDEVEAFPIADVYPSSFENENATLALVNRRAGIEPAISGSGSGGMQRRPNVYSAMGTLAQMQEGNSRVNLEASDFRHAHVQLGSVVASLYAKFGTDKKAQMFGLDEKHLKAALKAYSDHRLRIPIRAATASLNRELDKQSDMLMVGLMQRHYTAIAQLMQAIANPIVPPPVQDLLVKQVQSLNRFMKRILKDFGYDQPDIFIPEPKLPESTSSGASAGGQGPGAGGGMGAAIAAASSSGGGMAPAPGGAGVPGGPPFAPSAVQGAPRP